MHSIAIAIAIAQSNSGAVVKDCTVVTIMAKHAIDYLEAPNSLCFLICGNFFSKLNIEIAGTHHESFVVFVLWETIFFEWWMLLKSLQQLMFRILSGFFSDKFSPSSPCSIISIHVLSSQC
jgi:hypothetical protein